MMVLLLNIILNIVGKGKNNHFKHFLLLLQCFQRSSAANVETKCLQLRKCLLTEVNVGSTISKYNNHVP